MRLFAERGVDDTKVEDIVGAAGSAWGTFFRYFPIKEDVLLYAARLEHIRTLIPLVEAGIADGADARALALDLFEHLLMPGPRPLALHGAIVRESVARHDRYLAMLSGLPSTFDLVRRIVELGQHQGLIRPDEPPVLLGGVLACGTIYPTLHGFYSTIRSVASRTPATPEPIIRLSFAVAWRGLAPD